MKYLNRQRVVCLLGLILALCLTAVPTLAQKKGNRANDAQRRSEDAAKVFNEIMASDSSIPRTLVDKAQAIAVFPGVLKAAFIVGGREGKGVISRRTEAGWSAPAFFSLSGGSFGAQIGADKTDYVLLIMNEKGLNKLLEDKFELGGEVGVAAGPVGREASGATDAQLQAQSDLPRAGAFIGAASKARISPTMISTKLLPMKGGEVLTGGVSSTPEAVLIYPRTLSRY